MNQDLIAEIKMKMENENNQMLNMIINKDNEERNQQIIKRMKEIELQKLPPFLCFAGEMISNEISRRIGAELVEPMRAGELYNRIDDIHSDIEKLKNNYTGGALRKKSKKRSKSMTNRRIRRNR